MSNKAFDNEVNKEVYADNCNHSYKGRYVCIFCKNNDRTVPLFVREKDEKKTFVSYSKDDHLFGCTFPIEQEYSNAYSPIFTRESLFQRLLNKPHTNNTESKSSSVQLLSRGKRPTLKWLYNVCITNQNTYEFAPGCTVENSCLKKETLGYWYNKDKTEYPLLIIGSICYYDFDKLLIILSIGIYKINILFSDRATIENFSRECYEVNGQTVGTTIYLFGQLEDSVYAKENKFQIVNIYSKKQIKIKR